MTTAPRASPAGTSRSPDFRLAEHPQQPRDCPRAARRLLWRRRERCGFGQARRWVRQASPHGLPAPWRGRRSHPRRPRQWSTPGRPLPTRRFHGFVIKVRMSSDSGWNVTVPPSVSGGTRRVRASSSPCGRMGSSRRDNLRGEFRHRCGAPLHPCHLLRGHELWHSVPPPPASRPGPTSACRRASDHGATQRCELHASATGAWEPGILPTEGSLPCRSP